MSEHACPKCGDPLSTHGVCGSCGYGRNTRAKAQQNPDGDRWGILAAQAKDWSRSHAATSVDLTDQQWYNVSKFWPWVAAHCRRERPVVGPDHPLDATARQGPLMRFAGRTVARRGDDPDAIEREAIQTEAA